MNPIRRALFWLPLLLATAACTGAPIDESLSSSQESVAEESIAVSQDAVTDCRAFDGDTNKCNAAGCAYYFCSEQCHPKGTSYCNAGCFELCNAACRTYDGNLNACNAAGCAYFVCSSRCYTKGTSLCDAGCSAECNAACRTHDGDLNGCNAAGCAYYVCSNRCYTKGTTLCEAGCTDQCSVPERNSAFVSQSVPSYVLPGQSFQVSVTMRNTGAKGWSYDQFYRLGDSSRTWGLARGFLALGETIWPSYSKTFVLNLTAPSTPGTYNFQWQMVKDGVDAGWFGQLSPRTPITVMQQRDAAFVSQSVPTVVTAGSLFSASVTMRNTGAITWTAASGYELGTQSPQDNLTFGKGRIYLNASDSIATGGTKTFTQTFSAPGTPGTYTFQWRMLQRGIAWFGAYSPAVTITVVRPSSSSCGECPKGQTCPHVCDL
ncbi:hypothetical protein [Archangium violaceum]|uniref:hypothetical protein n=1 Tax=Archangium violaceum TaxID=83451 RepID=UPI0037C0067C